MREYGTIVKLVCMGNLCICRNYVALFMFWEVITIEA